MFQYFSETTQLKTPGFQEDILPVNALVITVKGLAKYNFPGPDLPWKLRLIAETVTCSELLLIPGPAPIHAPHPGSITFIPAFSNNSVHPFLIDNSFTDLEPN